MATLENYRFVLSYPIFVDAVKTSVLLGIMAATVIVALTFIMAWIALRAVPKAGWVLDSLAFTPIAVPHVIIGASVLFAYLMLPIPVYNTIWILLIAYVTMYLPYGMRFSSGGLLRASGWETINWLIFPIVAVILVPLIWRAARSGRLAPTV